MDVLASPWRSLRVTELPPLRPLEAMAMEKAVIGSDVGGIRELVREGVTRLLQWSSSVGDRAAKIAKLSDHPNLRRTLGRQTLGVGSRTARLETHHSAVRSTKPLRSTGTGRQPGRDRAFRRVG